MDNDTELLEAQALWRRSDYAGAERILRALVRRDPAAAAATHELGALLIHDIIPSPTFIAEEPVLAYSIFIAFFVATFMMLGLQSLMLRVFVLVTKIRIYVLASVILGFCGIGVFAINNVEFDLWTLL